MESEAAFLSLRLQSMFFSCKVILVWLCFNGIVAGHRSIDLPPVDDDLPLLKTFQYLYMSFGVRNQPKSTRLSEKREFDIFKRLRWKVAKVSNLISCLGIGEREGGRFVFSG